MKVIISYSPMMMVSLILNKMVCHSKQPQNRNKGKWHIDVMDCNKMNLQLTDKYLVLFAWDSCVCVLCTLYCTLLYAQVRGQSISVFDCENETVFIFLSVVDCEPLMMCTCVWLLGYLWLVWCRRRLSWSDQSLSGCSTYLHCSHTIWTRLCMTLPRPLVTTHLHA